MVDLEEGRKIGEVDKSACCWFHQDCFKDGERVQVGRWGGYDTCVDCGLSLVENGNVYVSYTEMVTNTSMPLEPLDWSHSALTRKLSRKMKFESLVTEFFLLLRAIT
jgi:hypothetical protein